MAKANLEADMHLAATQDGVLRKGNDGQGLRLSIYLLLLGQKGQKIIHAFRHQSRAEGFLFKCVAAEKDSLSPEQGSPTDCLIKSTHHTRISPSPGPEFAFRVSKESGTKWMTLTFVWISSNTHPETAIWWGKL